MDYFDTFCIVCVSVDSVLSVERRHDLSRFLFFACRLEFSVMRPTLSAFLCALCVLCGSIFGADGERFALLVGVNDYRPDSHLTALQYAEADTQQLAKALIDSGFKP